MICLVILDYIFYNWKNIFYHIRRHQYEYLFLLLLYLNFPYMKLRGEIQIFKNRTDILELKNVIYKCMIYVIYNFSFLPSLSFTR